MKSAEVKPGDMIAEKYEVDRVLGAGGMGVVVLAHHRQLDERVAIKFLLPDALGNEEAVQRFFREARAAAKIKNDHVARVRDVGTLESGSPYIVMEYLEGHDLETELEKRSTLGVSEAVDYLLQACEAIAEAHSLGIVHRDLKPANLFLTRRAGANWVKVLDFGISKMAVDKALTQSSAMMGSPQYMSPEQFTSSKDVDLRTDLWALGAILYESLTGRAPFDGNTLGELCHSVMFKEPKPVETLRGDVPEGLAQVVARSLRKDRDARFRHVGDFARALAPFAEARGQMSAEQVQLILQDAGISVAPESRENPQKKVITADTVVAPAGTIPEFDNSSQSGKGKNGDSTQGAWERNQSANRRSSLIFGTVALLALVGGSAFVLLKSSSGVDSAEGAHSAVAGPELLPEAAHASDGNRTTISLPSTEAPVTEPVDTATAPTTSASAPPTEAASKSQPAPKKQVPIATRNLAAKQSKSTEQPTATATAPEPQPAAKPAPKPAAKPAPKPAAKPAPKPAAKPASRADSLLDGRF